jgi:Na+:H+ antiporter, NhaA family
MKETFLKITHKLHPRRIAALTSTFLKDESISGKLILIAAIFSMVIVNSPYNGLFTSVWGQTLSIKLGSFGVSMDLRHWVNEGLMALFFLTVGLEIKRELVKGELKEFKTAILPIGAAVGGMIIPAVIYLMFNSSGESIKGWGIPIATDIAFAVAILSLLGRRVPIALKIFLLTLAIADDIGAIIIIALFYAEIIHYGYLLISILIVVALYLSRKLLIDRLVIVIFAGSVLWLTTHLSGIHASIVGAAMGLLAPVATKSHHSSVSEKVERFFLPISTFIVLPLFAFANAGFVLTKDAFNGNSAVLWGILTGLSLGKVIGIVLASWILIKLRFANLPSGTNWQHLIGVGFLAGIGFTVSIFITELAFSGNEALIDTSKIGIFMASALSALAGLLVLYLSKPKRDSIQQ